MDGIEKKEINILEKLEVYEVQNEKRMSDMDVKLTTILKSLKEKDAKIVALENSLKETQDILEKIKSTNQLQVDVPSKQKFKCEMCEFQSSSSNGLKTHISRKHTKYMKEVALLKCKICSKEFRSEKELKDHMIFHSFKDAEHLKFKCDECDFWGPNTFTMKMHFKRLHCENISCGMCDFIAKDVDTLDIHNSTCEMYKCNCIDCGKTYTVLGDIKEHLEKEHNKSGSINHYYRCGRNQEFFKEIYYSWRDLFVNRRN